MNEISKNKSFVGAIAIGKDLVAMLRDTFLFLIALFLVFFPQKLNAILTKAGFEEGSVVGFKWKASLAKSDEALKEAQTTITSLNARLDSTTLILKEVQQKTVDPSLKEKLVKTETGNQAVQLAAKETQSAVRNTISDNAELVKKVQQNILNNNSWGVVYSGDATLKAAQYEVNTVAPMYGLPNAFVFYYKGYYRSVSVLDDRDEAERVLQVAKQKRRRDAYIVPMSTWCPNALEKDGYKECAIR